MRALGNVGVARDEVRDVWIPPWLQGLSQDLRFAVRLLVKDRSFTAAAVLTLALGIGLNVAIFSAVYGILLKPLPFTDADRAGRHLEEEPTARLDAQPCFGGRTCEHGGTRGRGWRTSRSSGRCRAS